MIILLVIFSFVTKYVASLASPLFGEHCFQADNIIFYYVGRELLNGKVLYKDLMDNKTPYTFFINSLANLLPYKHIGLYIIESLLMALTLYYVYKIINLFVKDNIKSIMGAIVFGILLTNPYITLGMSKTECYVLPFMLGSTYTIFKLYENYSNCLEDKHKVLKFFIIGLFVGISFMFNIKTAFMSIVSFILLLTNYIKSKNMKLLIQTIVYTFFGFFISIFPYIVYMMLTKSIKYAFYNIFVVSSNYVSGNASYSFFTNNIIVSILHYISCHLLFFAFIVICLIVVLLSHIDKWVKCFYILTLITTIAVISAANNGFVYYLVMLFPYFLPIYIVSVKNIKFNKYYLIAGITISFALIMLINYRMVKLQYDSRCYFNNEMKNEVAKHIDFDEIKKRKVLALAFNPEAYMALDARLSFPSFFTMNNKYEASPRFYNNQLKYIKNLEPDIVIHRPESTFIYFPIPMQEEIINILNTKYEKISTVDSKSNYGIYEIYLRKNE